MKIKETSTRELAADWFTSKSYLEQHSLSDKYFESRNPSLLTIEQVEEIWKKETKITGYCEDGYPLNYSGNIVNKTKPNQKTIFSRRN